MSNLHIKSKWHQELEAFSQIKSALILEGNISDRYLYPQGETAGAWYPLLPYLRVYYRELGYKNVITYNHIDGFTAESEEMLGNFANRVGAKVNKDHIAGEIDNPDAGAPMIIRHAICQAEESTVILLDMASRYIAAPDQMSPDEQKSYSILYQAILGSNEVSINSGRARNLLVFIVNKQNDLPAWLYLNNDRIKAINIDYPSSTERYRYLSAGNMRSFFDEQVYREDYPSYADKEQELENIKNKFVARTEGFTYYELIQLKTLCRNRKIRIPNLCSVVDLYTYGIQENPWETEELAKRLETGEAFITARVKGQPEAVSASLDVLKRAVSGLSKLRNNASPKGVLFFAGPTGVGKTELAKTLAELIFGDQNACIRFDMSEYMQSNSDQRLLGAPPGYVGYEAGGQLTNAVRKNPFSILLFDEIEKASPTIMDKFLQILEDGRMTDGQGNTVYFSDSLIIFTSNLGIYKTDEYGTRIVNVSPDLPPEEVRSKVIQEIQDHFKLKLGRPEILNRIGENIIVFNYISEEAAKNILAARLKAIRATILLEKGIQFEFDAIQDTLLREAVKNLENGGRGINNILDKMLINPLSR